MIREINHGIDMSEFEKLCWSKSEDDQVKSLKILINYINLSLKNNWSPGEIKGITEEEVELASSYPQLLVTKFTSRLSVAIVTLIYNIQSYDKKFENTLLTILNRKNILSSILSSSIYGTTDHFILLIIDQYKKIKNPSNDSKKLFLNKLAILYTLNSQIHISKIFDNFKIRKEYIGNFCMGLLTENFIATKYSCENKNWLLKNLPKAIDEINIEFSNEFEKMLFLNPICGAYMLCSYSSIQERHLIKESIHKLIRKSNIANQIKNYEKFLISENKNFKKVEKKKPVIFVIHEALSSTHAMYRCYSSLIENLHAYFTVIGITFLSKNINDKAKKLFENHFILENSLSDSHQELIKLIDKYKPITIYYPSIGMDPNIILTASFRLAKNQIYSLGHPAPALSECLDASLFIGDCEADKDKYIKKNIQIETIHMSLLNPEIEIAKKWVLLDEKRINSNKKFKIAITATAFKLTYEFFSIIKSIDEIYNGKYELVFFVGTGRQFVDTQIFNYLNTHFISHTKVYSFLDYPEYMDQLSKCHMILTPYPFGSANSLLDAIRLGLVGPCLATKATHVQVNDIMLYSRCGLNEFIASNKKEYLEIIHELIDAYLGKPSKRMKILSAKYAPKESLNNLILDNGSSKTVAEQIYNFSMGE